MIKCHVTLFGKNCKYKKRLNLYPGELKFFGIWTHGECNGGSITFKNIIPVTISTFCLNESSENIILQKIIHFLCNVGGIRNKSDTFIIKIMLAVQNYTNCKILKKNMVPTQMNQILNKNKMHSHHKM